MCGDRTVNDVQGNTISEMPANKQNHWNKSCPNPEVCKLLVKKSHNLVLRFGCCKPHLPQTWSGSADRWLAGQLPNVGPPRMGTVSKGVPMRVEVCTGAGYL